MTLFLHKVESKLSAERQTMLRTARNREKVFEGRKVLLVDDDVRNIFALASALEQKGLQVEIGRNGFEALVQAGRGARHRPGADGRDDARHGRPGGHAPHPRQSEASRSCR